MPVSNRRMEKINGEWVLKYDVTYEPQTSVVKKPNRLTKDKSLTDLLGGPLV